MVSEMSDWGTLSPPGERRQDVQFAPVWDENSMIVDGHAVEQEAARWEHSVQFGPPPGERHGQRVRDRGVTVGEYDPVLGHPGGGARAREIAHQNCRRARFLHG